MLSDWLATTKAVQEEVYGVDFDSMTAIEQVDYLMYNMLAAYDELGEVLHEIGWKPWAKDRGWVNKQACTDELVDVLHFVANILVAIGVNDNMLENAYLDKRSENVNRQIDGYSTQNKPLKSGNDS